MAKKKKVNPDHEVSTTDLSKKVRGSWNGVNPITRIVESKKKKKPKYKHKIYQDDEN